MIKRITLLLMILIVIVGCQEDDPIIEVKNPPFTVDAGNDILNIEEFEIVLKADELGTSEKGTWSIISGLVDEMVYFDDKNDPQTTFHGLPGEEYKLVWTVIDLWEKTATDTVTVIFSPLKTEIINNSLNFYQTRLYLNAKKYHRGEWTVNKDYHWIVKDHDGSTSPDIESPNITFYGNENTNYILTWTTWYGSKSASANIEFNSSEFHEYEALEDLSIIYTNNFDLDDNGHVIKIHLGGDWNGYLFNRLDEYPSIQSLIHLKKLYLQGDGITSFPKVIPDKFVELEYLNLSGNKISSLPENVGNLIKLDTLLLSNNQEGKVLVELPQSFGDLESLSYLDISSMGLTNLPDSFGNLNNLKYLNLEGTVLSKLPDSFGNLIKLETFRGPELEQNIPDSFSNLTNLSFCFFYILNSVSTVTLPDDFGNLKNLQTLWVFADLENIPISFGKLINLKDLSIGSKENLPDNFGELRSLEKLNLSGDFKSLPDSFTKLTNLIHLRIVGELEYLPSDINNLTKLQYLIVDYTNLLEIPDSFGQLDNLTYFSSLRTNISVIPESFGNLSNLYELDLSYNSISNFPSTLTNLSDTLYKFRVRGNNYSDEEFNRLVEMLPLTKVIRY